MRMCIILLLSFLIRTASAQIVQIKYSKPFAILKFLETTKETHGTSGTFKKQIDSSGISKDPSFQKLVKDYKNLNLDYSYSKQAYPEKRKHTTSTWDLISIAAISSATSTEFLDRIIGMIPNDDYLRLKRILTKTEPFYDAFIYSSNQPAIQDKIRELNGLSPKLNELFDKFKLFYGSSWDKTMPFHLAIYPIFGKRGQTTATPHANSLEMGVLLEEDDNFGLLSIGMHEMCHVLFEEQPLALQLNIDSVFSNQKSPYAKLAYRYLDEALATALGNGYAYTYLSGELDTTEWYNDRYINQYAKAIYPLVLQYLEQGKRMDKSFIVKAIDTFKQTFPKSLYEFDALFMTTDIYIEDDYTEEIDDILNAFRSDFRVYMSNTFIPINDHAVLENVKVSRNTQFFMIQKNQSKNIEFIKTLFNNLENLPHEKNMLVSFLDKDNRPVIIIVAENRTKVIEGIRLLKTSKAVNPNQLWTKF